MGNAAGGVHAAAQFVLRTWTDTGSRVWHDDRWRLDEVEDDSEEFSAVKRRPS